MMRHLQVKSSLAMIPETIRIQDGEVTRMDWMLIPADQAQDYARSFTKDQLEFCRVIRRARTKNKKIRPKLIGG